MKTRPLPEIDLANFAALPPDEQRRRMSKMAREDGGHFSFNPARTQFPDILNSQPPMFAPLGRPPITPFEVIADALRKRCKAGDELSFNLAVSQMLYDYFRGLDVVSLPYHFDGLPIGVGRRISFWIPAYYVRDGQPVVSYIDPRGGKNLTQLGRDVAFATMHVGIRERVPDFENAILEIIQTPYRTIRAGRDKATIRKLCVRQCDAIRYTYDELDVMFSQTLALWNDVWSEHLSEVRKSAGKKGSLL
jgi:hypothetical protein